MPNMINLEDHFRLLRDLRETGDPSYEEFLLSEGIDLLAAFRSITDAKKRAAIFSLVKLVAEEEEQLPS